MSSPKRSISKKKADKLYELIHEDVMKVRVEINASVKDAQTLNFVDNLLSKLCYKTPQKAIDLFNVKTPTL